MLDTAQTEAQETANQPYMQDNAAQTEKDAQPEAFLTVRYNKEELPLTREAAAQFAQKGLNYDKISGRLSETAQKLEAYEDLGELARELAVQSGSDEKEALAALKQRIGDERDKQAAVNAQLDAFVVQYPGVDPLLLPETVLDAWKSGVPLIQAYASHAIAAEKTHRRGKPTRKTRRQAWAVHAAQTRLRQDRCPKKP